MKKISLLFAFSLALLFLVSCANTSGGAGSNLLPETSAPSTPDVDTETEKITISLGGLIGNAQTTSAGSAGFESITLQVVEGSSNIIGVATLPAEDTAISVEFDRADTEVTKKQEAVKSAIVKAFKDSLYYAGVNSITNTNITVNIADSFTSAIAVITNLTAREKFEFNGPNPTIEIALDGDFAGLINIDTILNKEVEKTIGKAGIKGSWLTEGPHEVSFEGRDIFEQGTRATALRAMIEDSFIPSLAKLKIKSTFTSESIVTESTNSNKAWVELTLTAPNGLSLIGSGMMANPTQVVTIEFTNEYGAFSGVKPIEQADITLSTLVPEVTNAVVVGTTSWAISGGSTPGGTRKIAVGEEGSIDVPTVISSIVEKAAIAASQNTKFTFTGAGEYTKDDNTGLVIFPLIFEKKPGYLFASGEPTETVNFSYTFSIGALQVGNSDFEETLALLQDQKNLAALKDKDGNVTIDIIENITNEKDENGQATPFTVNGKEEELNLVLKTSAEEGASVSGGGILTSLIVEGTNTTVTVEEGITINAGANAAIGEGGGVTVRDGAIFILNGGEITGNKSTVDNYTAGGGSGVYVTNATFIMKSGKIHGNEAIRGAGVYVGDNGVFEMHDGEISANIAQKHGGGLYVRSNSDTTFAQATLYGGKIYNNTVTVGLAANKVGSGAGISIAGFGGSNINIPKGSTVKIYENISPDDGIAIVDRGTFKMEGGEVYNNQKSDGTIHEQQIVAYANINNFEWIGGTINGENPPTPTE